MEPGDTITTLLKFNSTYIGGIQCIHLVRTFIWLRTDFFFLSLSFVCLLYRLLLVSISAYSFYYFGFYCAQNVEQKFSALFHEQTITTTDNVLFCLTVQQFTIQNFFFFKYELCAPSSIFHICIHYFV